MDHLEIHTIYGEVNCVCALLAVLTFLIGLLRIQFSFPFSDHIGPLSSSLPICVCIFLISIGFDFLALHSFRCERFWFWNRLYFGVFFFFFASIPCAAKEKHASCGLWIYICDMCISINWIFSTYIHQNINSNNK